MSYGGIDISGGDGNLPIPAPVKNMFLGNNRRSRSGSTVSTTGQFVIPFVLNDGISIDGVVIRSGSGGYTDWHYGIYSIDVSTGAPLIGTEFAIATNIDADGNTSTVYDIAETSLPAGEYVHVLGPTGIGTGNILVDSMSSTYSSGDIGLNWGSPGNSTGPAGLWNYTNITGFFTLPSLPSGTIVAAVFNSTLTRLFVLADDEFIFQFDMTAGDVTTLTYSGNSFNSSGVPSPFGAQAISITDNDSKLIVANASFDDVARIDMSTANDLSTASNPSNGSDLNSSDDATFLSMTNDGLALYVRGGNTSISEYVLSSAFDLATLGSRTNVSISGDQGNLGVVKVNADGSIIWTTDETIDTYKQYSLSTPQDITTLASTDIESSHPETSADILDIAFDVAGTTLCTIDDDGSAYSYAPSTAFAFSTTPDVGTVILTNDVSTSLSVADDKPIIGLRIA